MENDSNNKSKTSAERIIIFVDGSNFYHSVHDTFDLHDNQIDFRKMIEILRTGRLLIGVYYYNASLDRGYNAEVYWKQQKFFSDLRTIPGFHVILANMRKIKKADGTFEFTVKGDDVYLGIDMVSLAYEDAYDTAILVSGDGDFVPAVKRIQKLGKRAENAYFLISKSDFLKKVCNSSLILDDIVEKECIKEKDN